MSTGYALLQLPDFLLTLYEKLRGFIRNMSHNSGNDEANEHGAGSARNRNGNFADDGRPHIGSIQLLQEVSL